MVYVYNFNILSIYTTVQRLAIALVSRPPNIARYRGQPDAGVEMRVVAARSTLLPGALYCEKSNP